MNWQSITICGGGNGAHGLIALLLNNSGSRLNLYLPLKKELQQFRSFKERRAPFTLIFKGKELSVPMDRLFITSNPKEGAEADLIILVFPAFAHKDILNSLASYLREGTVLAVLGLSNKRICRICRDIWSKDEGGSGFSSLSLWGEYLKGF